MVPIPSGTSVVDTTIQYGHNSIFYNYTATDCANYTAGTIVVVFDQNTGIATTVTPIVTLGSATGVSFSATIVSGLVNLNITVPGPNWNLNLSKIVFLDLCAPSCDALVTENGDTLITEDGNTITVECCIDQYLLTENGDYLITENGEFIILECTPPTQPCPTITTENGNIIITQDGNAITTDCGSTTTTTSTTSTTSTTTTAAPTYTIGQAALGGVIAYIDGGGTSGTSGLVATVADISTGAPWGCKGTLITGADGMAIGTGNQNTIDILAQCPTAGIAARLCGDLVQGGYNDWYLPSQDELNALYTNKVAIGGFVESPGFLSYYWSSSEISANNAWSQQFSSGNQSNEDKQNNINVRAIRSF